MKKNNLLLFAMLVTLGVGGCTANASKEGVCKRSCGSRPVGGGKIRGLALSNPITFKNCSPGAALPQQKFYYLIYEDTSTGTTATTGGSTPPGPTSVPSRIPKAGVAFTPIVDGNGVVDSVSNDWCTDSCGIAEVKFTPVCVEQDVSIGVLVPGMLYDDGATAMPSVKFTVTME